MTDQIPTTPEPDEQAEGTPEPATLRQDGAIPVPAPLPPAPDPAPVSGQERLVPPPPAVAAERETDEGADALPPVPRRPADQLPPPVPEEGPPAAPRRKHTGMWVALAVVATLLIAAAAGTWWYLLRRTGPAVASGTQVEVVIREGSDIAAIASGLARSGVVNNSNMFQLAVRMSGMGDQLKAGTYELTTGMPDDAVIDALALGPASDSVPFTVPEGSTIRSIATRLQKQTGISAKEFTRIAGTEAQSFHKPFLAGNKTKSLEGYLFPKTYAIKKGATARQVIDRMLDQFGEEIGAIDMSYARSKNLTIHDVVTIASIVEKETPLAKERKLVASVVYNRLRKKMVLGMESTVRYALGGAAGTLSYRDVRVDSPYNTYTHKGLPPGPICNPGLAALEAAAHPADTDYLYFVTTGEDGSSTFTINAADFEKAKARMKQ